MIQIKRPYQSIWYSTWFSSLVFVLCFMGTALFSSLFFKEVFLDQEKELTSVQMVWFVLGVSALAILTFFIGIKFTGTSPASANKEKKERVDFLEKYGTTLKGGGKKTRFGIVLFMFLTMALFAGVIFLLKQTGKEAWFDIVMPALGMLYVVFGIPFILYLNRKNYQKVYDQLPSLIPETDLYLGTAKLHRLDISPSTQRIMGMDFSGKVSGTFRGYPVELVQSGTMNRMKDAANIFTVKIFASFPDLKKSFALEEQNPQWKVIEGNTTEEAFRNRFKLTPEVHLPSTFQEACVSFLPILNLTFKEDCVEYYARVPFNAFVLQPYIRVEGQVLLLDFLINLTQQLKGKPRKNAVSLPEQNGFNPSDTR